MPQAHGHHNLFSGMISIEVDGQLVYKGKCVDGCYVKLVELPYKRSVQPPESAVVFDYSEDGSLIGVEILARRDGFNELDAIVRLEQRKVLEES